MSRRCGLRCQGEARRSSTLVSLLRHGRLPTLLTLAFTLAAGNLCAQTRAASDFELRQMEAQAAHATDYLSQLSAHLNLGDVRAARGESTRSRSEYERALSLSERERVAARRASALGRYATATAYAGLAHARLNQPAEAFDDLEEAIRYGSDSGRIWNLYSTTMAIANLPEKAVASARNAVAAAERDLATADSIPRRLDLAVYRYSLASSLLDEKDPHAHSEAAALLQSVIAALEAAPFQPIREEIARVESFEIYSTARGDASSYISVLNRSHLRLARLAEEGGDRESARAQYAAVLLARNDDPTALAGMARLAAGDDRGRYFAEAFDANPFSIDLIRRYEQYIAGSATAAPEEQSTGARVRLLLQELSAHRTRAAADTLEELARGNEGNEVVAWLAARLALARGDAGKARATAAGISRADLRADLERRFPTEVEGPPAFLSDPGIAAVTDPSPRDLRSVIRLFSTSSILPEQREALDRLQFSSKASMDAGATGSEPSTTSFERGTIEGIPFRFQSPTLFRGPLIASRPLRLTYRILGVTDSAGADELLLEPLRLEGTP
jgi:hypothetical protein